MTFDVSFYVCLWWLLNFDVSFCVCLWWLTDGTSKLCGSQILNCIILSHRQGLIFFYKILLGGNTEIKTTLSYIVIFHNIYSYSWQETQFYIDLSHWQNVITNYILVLYFVLINMQDIFQDILVHFIHCPIFLSHSIHFSVFHKVFNT